MMNGGQTVMLSEEGRVVVSGCAEKEEGRAPKKLLNSSALPVGLNDARGGIKATLCLRRVFSDPSEPKQSKSTEETEMKSDGPPSFTPVISPQLSVSPPSLLMPLIIAVWQRGRREERRGASATDRRG